MIGDKTQDTIVVVLAFENISKINEREEYWLKKFDVSSNPLFYNKTNRSRGWSVVTEEQKTRYEYFNAQKEKVKERTSVQDKSVYTAEAVEEEKDDSPKSAEAQVARYVSIIRKQKEELLNAKS
jgi:hypothetical protein